jgi:drug/metabolite transporter (DMT)-like permease
MAAPSWLWIVFTLIGATGQSLRNAAQRSMTERLGTVGATHIRFIFGLPFGLLFLAIVHLVGGQIVVPNAASVAWVVMGAVCQIAATALMLATMRDRSFVVTTAYTKTEPVQVAIFAVIFLGEHLSPTLAAAVVVATAGVLILSWPTRKADEVFSWRPAALGIASGGLFALAAVGFRGGILALGTSDYVPAATQTLALSLLVQTVLLSGWLLVRDPEVLWKVLRAWRPSLAAGFLGSFASEMWFLAFALQAAAPVRTLGLVELIVAGIISRRLFAQTPSPREIIGMVMVVIGIALLFNG